MMNRDNLYYAELAVSGEPPNFSKEKWRSLTMPLIVLIRSEYLLL